MLTSKTIYDFDCIDLQGKPLSLRQYQGQPMVIVNTASLCSFSTQYEGLESLWQKHKSEGLTVISVPSNDFGRQEPGNSTAIASLCSSKFGVTFPILQKTPVTGPNAHPLFQWLAHETGFVGKVRWNFYKYLIGRDGHVKEWFTFLTKPETQRFESAISTLVRKA